MKKTAVIGLGIIGASLCRALKKAGHTVAGDDSDESTLSYALAEGYIDEKIADVAAYDVVFLAVPPSAAIALLTGGTFKPGAFVADVCGVKGKIEDAVRAAPRVYRYIGLHPMAGREVSGIRASSAELFSGANLVITVAPDTCRSALEEAREYARALGFGRIVECSAAEHDEKIALTSQLAHILANAYVKSPRAERCKGFTGGSFQDMTRVAGVDERLWTQLYMLNKENLVAELEGLISSLKGYADALATEDEEKLCKLLKEGRLARERVRREKK